jgi:hypothetical protein
MEKSMANCRRPAAKSEMLKQRADKILQSISRHLNKIQRGKTSHNTATSTLLKKRDKFYTQFKGR